jgi:Response regulator receiver domain
LDSLRRAGISPVPAPSDISLTLELVPRHRPEVVLLDDELPGLGGVAGLHPLAPEIRDSHVVIITGRYEQGLGARALLAGAAGYLSRELPPGRASAGSARCDARGGRDPTRAHYGCYRAGAALGGDASREERVDSLPKWFPITVGPDDCRVVTTLPPGRV